MPDLKRTYTDAQIGELGREIVFAAGEKLKAAVSAQASVGVFSSDRVSALSEAIHAGMTMVEYAPDQEPD